MFYIEPEAKACANCKYFYQHYVYIYRGFFKTYKGHCSYKRIKDRHVTDYCENFEMRTKQQ